MVVTTASFDCFEIAIAPSMFPFDTSVKKRITVFGLRRAWSITRNRTRSMTTARAITEASSIGHMIGPPLMKMWTRFAFWTRAFSAPPRDGSSGRVPSPDSTSSPIAPSIEPSSGRTNGFADPTWGTATPPTPLSERKSDTGPIMANCPCITEPSVSTPTPAKRLPPTMSKRRFRVRLTNAVWREVRSVGVSVLFSTACLAVSIWSPRTCSSPVPILVSKVRTYSSSRFWT